MILTARWITSIYGITSWNEIGEKVSKIGFTTQKVRFTKRNSNQTIEDPDLMNFGKYIPTTRKQAMGQ
jgi:hypothetical protein